MNDTYAVYTPAAAALLTWLNAVRPSLISYFGTYSWNADWAAAGWVNGTTEIPDGIEARLGLAESLIAYLTKHADAEVPPKVTAANGTTIRNATLAAQSAVIDAEKALKDADNARTTPWNTLIADMRGIIKNLASCLAKDDTRWLSFGLQMPAANATRITASIRRASWPPPRRRR